MRRRDGFIDGLRDNLTRARAVPTRRQIAKEQTPDVRLMTRPFVIVLVANFAHWLSFLLLLHLPSDLAARGIGSAEIGIIMGAMALTAVAVRPAVGRLLDTQGRRPLLLVGGVLNVVACLSYQLPSIIYLSRALHGIAQGTLFSALFTTAADVVSGTRRSQGLGLFTLSGMLPLLLTGPLGDVAIALYGFSALFAAATAAAAVGLVLCLGLDEPPRPSGSPGSFFGPLLCPELQPLLFATFLAAFGVASYYTFMKTFLAGHGLGSMTLFFAPYAAAGIVLRVFLAQVPDRLGAKRVLFGGFVCLVAGLAVLWAASGPASIVVAALLCGTAHGYVFLVLSGLLVGRTREDQRGLSLAVFTALFDAGLLVGAVGLGGLVERVGHAAMFGVTAIVVAVGVVIFGAWDRGARVVLLAPAGEDAAHILRALKATGASVVHVQDVAQLDTHARGVDLVVADRILADAPSVTARGGSEGPKCLLYSTALPTGGRGDAFGGSTEVTNFLAGSPRLASDELFATVTKLLSHDIFGLEKYFAWGSPSVRHLVHGPADREAALDAVLGLASAHEVHPRWSRLIASMVDELVMNALSAGPDTERLPTPIEVRASYDGRRFGISVSDPFGRFDLETASCFTNEWFQHRDERIAPQERGIGLHHVMSSLSHLVINLARDERTEMIGLLDVRTRYRDFLGKTKSMNIFVQPEDQERA